MGGTGSGQSGGRPTVEGSLSLDLGWLRRKGALQPGRVVRFSTSWSHGSGRVTARADIEVRATDDAGEVRIVSLTRYDTWGEPRTVETRQAIRLETTPGTFGGLRWWFVCPSSGRYVLKLHCPLGTSRFASRKAYRLGYACQRESTRDRAFSRARKARRRLGGTDNLTLPIPDKPKWMRWPTYWRLVDQTAATEGAVLGFSAAALERLQRRLGRAA